MLSRRNFFNQSAGILALGRAAPLLWRQAARASEPRRDSTILVVLELTGGNDGLNTVIPHADDVYHKSRPTLRVEPGKVLKLDDCVGLHPVAQGAAPALGEGRPGGRSGGRLSGPEPFSFPVDGNLADGDPRPRSACRLAGAAR